MGKEYRQGVYHPTYPDKYVGKKSPVFRSGYELKLFKWCDLNSKVLKWSSETIVVPYKNPLDQKIHRYFVDMVIVLDTPNGPKKYLVEVKPLRQTKPPVHSKRKKQRTILYENAQWIINKAKWSAAKKWANDRGFEFTLITEESLGIKGR